MGSMHGRSLLPTHLLQSSDPRRGWLTPMSSLLPVNSLTLHLKLSSLAFSYRGHPSTDTGQLTGCIIPAAPVGSNNSVNRSMEAGGWDSGSCTSPSHPTQTLTLPHTDFTD